MVITWCCGIVARIEASTGHWLCSPPRWTAHVGRPWKPFDEEPLNLYNQWWRVGQWIFARDL